MECKKGKPNKKLLDDIDGELLGSLVDAEKKDETGLNGGVKNTKDGIIKEYEELLKE